MSETYYLVDYPREQNSHSHTEYRCIYTAHGKIDFVTGLLLQDPNKINDGICKGFDKRNEEGV
jgi:hypothetical protein